MVADKGKLSMTQWLFIFLGIGKFLPLVHLLIYEISYPNVFAKAVFFCLDKYNNLSNKYPKVILFN